MRGGFLLRSGCICGEGTVGSPRQRSCSTKAVGQWNHMIIKVYNVYFDVFETEFSSHIINALRLIC